MMVKPGQSVNGAIKATGAKSASSNRLGASSSVYLQQHAHQAIHWHTWGREAFELAAITNKLVFVSIGYSSCHWCHVMSHTTFDRSDVAEALNRDFVAIKVDRDQHPDIDQVYMMATQLLTHHGGWPNSVFCLPTGQPFFAGTYFAADDRQGQRGFLSVLHHLNQAWQQHPDQVKHQAKELEMAMIQAHSLAPSPGYQPPWRECMQATLATLRSQYDAEYGGFGRAPKFPPFSALTLLMLAGEPSDQSMVTHTLRAMALSGLRDAIDGGFHRYTTDASWHAPHFEKMMTDNAQMISLYSEAYAQTADPLFLDVVQQTVSHILTDWACSDHDGFFSTIDADSDGVEGHYYVMTWDELMALGDDMQPWAEYFQFTPTGNLNDEATGEPTGYNIFHPIDDNPPGNLTEFRQRIQRFRADHRSLPKTDAHQRVSTQAMLVVGLIRAADTVGNPEWLAASQTLFNALIQRFFDHLDNQYVDDALHLLMASLSHASLHAHSHDIWSVIMDRFYDPINHGVWFSQLAHHTPITRIKEVFDQAVPSPQGLLIELAVKMAECHQHDDYLWVAQSTMVSVIPMIQKGAMGTESFWIGVASYWRHIQSSNSRIQVQSIQASWSSGHDLHVIIDAHVDGFLLCGDPFTILNDDQATWRQFKVSPTHARRLGDGDDIQTCANGAIRIEGRVAASAKHDSLVLGCNVCTDSACLPTIEWVIPLLN